MSSESAAVPAPAPQFAVALQNVTFTYPNGRTVLDIPDLHLLTGEKLFLHGPSGSGKSTLLSLIAGVLRPTGGELHVLGRPFHTLSAASRDRVRGTGMGYIFQSFNLIPYLTVRQNIALPGELYATRLRHLRNTSPGAEVERLAKRLGIADHLHDRIGRLSVGQQQRVAIARALLGAPSLLIADEPTSSLDANRRDEFIDLLLEMLNEAREHGTATTLLYVSHDTSIARHFQREVSLPQLNRAGSGQARAAA